MKFRSGRGGDTQRRRRFLLASLGGIAALVVGGVVFEMIRTRDDITSSGGAMWLNAQIRLPPGVAAPDKDKKIVLELCSD